MNQKPNKMDEHKLVQNTYNQIANKYHQKWGNCTDFFLNNADKFIALLPKNANIIDLGCGIGRDSKYFSGKGLQVLGIDFSKNMLKIAREFAPKANFYKKISEIYLSLMINMMEFGHLFLSYISKEKKYQ